MTGNLIANFLEAPSISGKLGVNLINEQDIKSSKANLTRKLRSSYLCWACVNRLSWENAKVNNFVLITGRRWKLFLCLNMNFLFESLVLSFYEWSIWHLIEIFLEFFFEPTNQMLESWIYKGNFFERRFSNSTLRSVIHFWAPITSIDTIMRFSRSLGLWTAKGYQQPHQVELLLQQHIRYSTLKAPLSTVFIMLFCFDVSENPLLALFLSCFSFPRILGEQNEFSNWFRIPGKFFHFLYRIIKTFNFNKCLQKAKIERKNRFWTNSFS